MKKRTLLLAMLITALLSFTVHAEDLTIVESPNVKIVIDGEIGDYEDVPLIVNDRTMLPLRAVLTNLGIPNDDAHIIWNGEERSVTVITADGDTTVWLQIDNYTAKVNGTDMTLDVAPMIYAENNRTYIPARFISETLGKKVVWDGSTIAVLITDEDRYNSIKEVLEKSESATAEIENYTMDLSFNIATGGEEPFSMDLIMSAVENPQQPAAYTKLGVDMDLEAMMDEGEEADPEALAAQMMLAAFLNFEIYEMEDYTYSKSFFSGDGWLKSETVVEDETEEEDLQLTQDTVLPGTDDAVIAGLIMRDNETEGTIELEGAVYMTEIIDQTESMSSSSSDGSTLENYHILYTIDRETYAFISLEMAVEGTTVDETTGEPLDTAVTVYVTMEALDEGYELVVPDDVLENIVELDFGF